MAENSKIQWTDHTWSPWRGCAKVSPGCTNCYAEKLSLRNPAVLGEWGVGANRVINADWNKPMAWYRKAVKLAERHRVFPSLCDPFEVRQDLAEPRQRFFNLVDATPNLDWLVLTKRPGDWRYCWPLDPIPGHVRQNEGDGKDWRKIPNLWMGVSVENQEYADKRLAILRQIPASVRWVSYEPALGPVDFTPYLDFIDWIVCGGESGHGARPFDLRWAESVRDQCKAHGTAFYMKQVGSRPVMSSDETNPIKRTVVEKCNAGWIERHIKDAKGGDISEFPEDLRVREFPAAKGARP